MGKTPIELHNKIFYHPDKIKDLLNKGETIPITWELDTTNMCNHNCIGCKDIGAGGRSNNDSLTYEEAKNYTNQIVEIGSKAITITGGGEPLMNNNTPKIIEYIKSKGLDVAIITNGTLLNDESIDIIVKNCTWVRISIDAGDSKTYKKVRNVPEHYFKLAFENMEKLVKRKKELKSTITIGSSFLTSEITIPSLVKYTKKCKKSGVDYIQIRTYHRNYIVPYNITEVKSLEDDNFKIYYSDNKYKKDYKKTYQKCLAYSLSGVINVHSVYICCHFRGIENKKLGDLRENTLLEIWYSERKNNIIKNLNIKKCLPNCRLDLVNQEIHKLIYNDIQHKNFI